MMTKNSLLACRPLGLWLVALLLTPIFQFLTVTESAAQSPCEKELTEAQRQYDNGFFKEAMASVEQ
ncbi:MAG: hypothetical protein ACRENG_21620, partial [bacterium]